MYQAIITPITNIRPHPDADKVQLGTAAGYQVVIGLETKEGTLGVFFPEDGQLAHEHCMFNKLYRKHPDTLQPMGGYFEHNRRVRVQKFRKEISEGFWQPLESLAWTGAKLDQLEVGFEFHTLNGKEVCNKYYTPATLKAMASAAKTQSSRKRYHNFHQHFDTPKLRTSIHRIRPESIIYVSEKLHGCVSYDTLVETLEYGTCKIGPLVENKTPVHIKGLDHETRQVVYTQVSDYYYLEDDGDWYEIELEDGSKLEITGNNPVWLPQIQAYRRADELKIGDLLLKD